MGKATKLFASLVLSYTLKVLCVRNTVAVSCFCTNVICCVYSTFLTVKFEGTKRKVQFI